MLSILAVGTPLYMKSPTGPRLEGIVLERGHWGEPLFTFPTAGPYAGRDRIGEYHMLGYYRRYVSPGERRSRVSSPLDHLFVVEGLFKDQSLSAVEEAGLSAEHAPPPPPLLPVQLDVAAVMARLAGSRVVAGEDAEEEEEEEKAKEPPPCVAAAACADPIAAALERIRIREAELQVELADLEQVRAAKERLAALELRVAEARKVLESPVAEARKVLESEQPGLAESRMLIVYGIKSASDFKAWAIRNHPDKGWCPDVFATVTAAAKKVYGHSCSCSCSCS